MSPSSTERRCDVFISYASEDVEQARWVRSELDRRGWRCFVSEDDLSLQVGSSEWSESIDRMLDEAPILVLLVSPQALDSQWVTYEWRSVHNSILSGQPGMLIPICVRGPAPDQLPRALRRYQCVDCRDIERRGTQIEKAVGLARGYLERVGGATAAIAEEPPRSAAAPTPVPLAPVPTSTTRRLFWKRHGLSLGLASGLLVTAVAVYQAGHSPPPPVEHLSERNVIGSADRPQPTILKTQLSVAPAAPPEAPPADPVAPDPPPSPSPKPKPRVKLDSHFVASGKPPSVVLVAPELRGPATGVHGSGTDRVAGPFDRAAAKLALSSAAEAARACKSAGGPTGDGRVAVTFGNSGRVTSAAIQGGPLAGTAVGACIAARFQALQVPAFGGASVTVAKRVAIE